MQQSNIYIVGFAIALAVVLGGTLATVKQVLKEDQDKAEKLFTRKSILKSVTPVGETDDVYAIFEKRFTTYVVDIDGKNITPQGADPLIGETINIEKEYKKKVDSEKQLPVFVYTEEGATEPSSYVFPVYGNGLWDRIWGWVALESDLSTVRGVVFDHKGETPGLGARITEDEIRTRYDNKQLFEDGKLVGIEMLKGEGNPESVLTEHKVDGLSGATLTANGVNDMLDTYFEYYKPTIAKIKSSGLSANLSVNN